MILVKQAYEFEWDKGNSGKSEKKHGVCDKEAEKSFFDEGKIIYKDVFHSVKEERFILLGRTHNKRILYVVFTYRKKKIRIISARTINKKEVSLYEKGA